jgi:hypothetical protein
MRVRLWRHWPLDGQLLEPGDEVEVAAIDGVQICSAGAGEPVREVDVELAVTMAPERGITRRQRRRKGRR